MRRGFTLIELLVVTAVFSITVLVATTVFTRVQTSQQGILARQRVVADGRYVLEAMTRAAKLGTPDFSFYANGYAGVTCLNQYGLNCDLSFQQSILAVRDQTNIQTCYRKNGTSLETYTAADSTGVCNLTTPSLWSDITPADLIIDEFRVSIKPIGNPFRPTPASAADCQPSKFDQTNGVCACLSQGDCFTGQTCDPADPNDATSISICKNPNIQPYVTIFLSTRSRTTSAGTQASSSMETTVVSRVYKR